MAQQKSEDRVVPEGGVMPAERVGSSPGGQGKAVPVEETAVQLRLPIATAEHPRGATRRGTRDRLGEIRAGAPKAIGKTGTASSATMEEVAYRLTDALLKVASNKGAPGPDGQTIEVLLEQWPVVLPRLQADLLAGRYRPGGIRRAYIPKAGGGQRGLGILELPHDGRAGRRVPSTVQRIWSARGIKPHRVETFKLSNDPNFEEKLVNVVGLYMNPPEKAVVLCMDEKSQIQALDRTQPSLPIKPGRAGTMTRDYKRNGTTTLFAALDVLTGTVIGRCLPRHRHIEFLAFLKTIDREVPGRLQIHLILDNYATHNHPKVKTWLARHPRFQLHFTPTSSSWLNMVEIFFGQLTDKAIRRGIFHSVPDLIDAIQNHLAGAALTERARAPVCP